MAKYLGVKPLAAGQLPPRAALVILARNQDLEGVLLSMTRLEARFNNTKYRQALDPYPQCHALSLP